MSGEMGPIKLSGTPRRHAAAALFLAMFVADGAELRRGSDSPRNLRGRAHQALADVLASAWTVASVHIGQQRTGDFDFDGDVDLDDYVAFHGCLLTRGGPGCFAGDFDLDLDVDLGDFAGFQSEFLRPPADTDGDRIPDIHETNDGVFLGAQATGTDPANPDTDGDALPDGDEAFGTTNGLDLPSLGASPLFADLFVEVDWTADDYDVGPHDHQPSDEAMLQIMTAFDLGPRPNPYGAPPGIRLHVDYGQGGVFTGGNLIPGSPEFIVFGMEFDALRDANLALERFGYFHYAIFTHRFNSETNNSSGIAQLHGDRFMITLAFFPEDGSRVSKTFMHELGHNLNLLHGGDEGLNQKPNYNSVMNYRYQFPGVDTGCDTLGDGVPDYSRGALATLDENHLDECVGVCGPGSPIDWNESGGDCEMDVAFDITVGPDGDQTLDVLRDFDDWNAILFDGLTSPTRAEPSIIACQGASR